MAGTGATFEARMQVRRSPLVEEKLIGMNSEFYPRGVVGGGNPSPNFTNTIQRQR